MKHCAFLFVCFFTLCSIANAAQCTSTQVRIRRGAGTNNGIVRSSRVGEQFVVVGNPVQAGGFTWRQVKPCGANTQPIGWMADKWFYNCPCPNAPPPPPPVAATPKPVVVVPATPKPAVVASPPVGQQPQCVRSRIRIRAGPSTRNAVVRTSRSGEAFEVFGNPVQRDGYTWREVRVCGGNNPPLGWMADKWFYDCPCPNTPNPPRPTNPNNNNNNNNNNTPTGGPPRRPLKYDAPRRCSRGPSQGANALKNVLTPKFPGVWNGGVFNCRSVRGGGSLSEHGEGRAWDAMVKPGDPVGQRLADWLVANADRLGIQSVIYNRKVWGYGRWFWRRYSGSNPHVDHVHVGINRHGASTISNADVEAVYRGASPPRNGNPVTPAPGTPAPPSADCLRVRSALNIRGGPSTRNPVLLVAFAGEQFRKTDQRGNWIKMSNNRGSGWGYGSFVQACAESRMAVSRSDTEEIVDTFVNVDKTIQDGPQPIWHAAPITVGVVAGLAAAFVVVALLVKAGKLKLMVPNKKNGGNHNNDSLTEPLLSSPRARKRRSENTSVGGIVSSSPARVRRSLAREAKRTSVHIPL